MEINKIIEDIKKLNREEKVYLFLTLFEKKIVDFNELSRIYVKSLENAEEKHAEKKVKLTIKLTDLFDIKLKIRTDPAFTDVDIAKELIDGGFYAGTEYENILKKITKK